MELNGRLSLATIGEDALFCAKEWGAGIELDECSFVTNLQAKLSDWEPRVLQKLQSAPCGILHGPFCEMLPASCDPLIVEAARKRFEQAYGFCRRYGVDRMVVHSGYLPRVFYREWFIEKTALFWREYLSDKPETFRIAVENVLDEEPGTLAETIDAIGDRRAGVCFDVGHAFCSATGDTRVSLEEWIETLGSRIVHVHLHDNDGLHDRHWPLGEGKIPFEKLLSLLERCAPEATYTIEGMRCAPSMQWLAEHGYLKK